MEKFFMDKWHSWVLHFRKTALLSQYVQDAPSLPSLVLFRAAVRKAESTSLQTWLQLHVVT